jgi:RNA polymerase sigma factor (sigma-70 family)
VEDSRHAPFPPTRASLVGLLGAPGSPAWRATWERFFRDYWRPLYAWLRRTGTDASDALDLLQDFFAAGLEGAIFSDYDPARGRLRTYLLACLGNHRRKAWRKASARPDRAPWLEGADEPAADDPDAAFERDWVRCQRDRAVAEVERRLEGEELRLLRAWVLAVERPPIEALAAELGISRGALYTRASRLRQALADEVTERLRVLDAAPDALEAERDALRALLARAAEATRDEPARFAGHDLLVVLGEDPTARLYLARSQEGEVALELLHAELARTPVGRRRFLDGVRRVDHPHVVRCLGVDEVDGRPYAIFEQLPGGPVQGGLDVVRARALVADACRGVLALGFHGDLDPSRLWLTAQRRVKLAGPGRVRAGGFALDPAGFRAPEQLSAGPVDARADVWALGAILRALTGVEDEVTRRATAFALEERFAHVGALLAALEEG